MSDALSAVNEAAEALSCARRAAPVAVPWEATRLLVSDACDQPAVSAPAPAALGAGRLPLGAGAG
jgi:hypothetical protein